MANITDQFVTSFSELYIGNKVAVGAVTTLDTDTKVRGFFTPTGSPVEAVASASVAAAAVVKFTDGDFVVYVKNTSSSSASIPSTLTVAATLAVAGFELFSARIPLVMEIGTLSNEATVIDTPTFGEKFKGKLRGQLDGGQLDAQLYWAPRSPVHQILREYAEDGTAAVVGIKWKSDADGTDTEYVVFDSFVSSFGIDTTFDDVAKASTTMVVDGAEVFATHSGT